MEDWIDRLRKLLIRLSKVSVLGLNTLTVIIFTAVLAFLALLSIVYRLFLGSYF